MNSFFKGLIRGLLAIIPICLIVCVLFAGQRLMLTDRTSVSSRNAATDVDSVSAEQTNAPAKTLLLRLLISVPAAAGSLTEELHRTPSVRMIRPFLLTLVTRLFQTIVPNLITYAIPTTPLRSRFSLSPEICFLRKTPCPATISKAFPPCSVRSCCLP